MSPNAPIWGVDAFTGKPFRGNPAAVCLLDSPADEAWMQAVAAEMNLSETAFVVDDAAPGPGADGALGLRWFTPAVEVALCGHATLATAHVLWETGRLAPTDTARFKTASGVLTAARGAGDAIELDFPALASVVIDVPVGLSKMLGANVVAAAQNPHDLLVELEDASAVRTLAPDLAAIAKLVVRGVVVTARGEPGTDFDFVSRFFAPRAGVPEDPVTGSAHCALAPYWAERLGTTEFTAYQASPRGGVVHCRLAPPERVILGGDAVTVWHGTLA